jgi:hypothetical protein
MLEDIALFAVIPSARVLDLVEDKPADFRTKNVVAARSLGECFAKADLREPGPVERSGVEEARARVPGRVDRRTRFIFRNISIHVAKRRRAKSQRPRQQCFSDSHLIHPVNGVLACRRAARRRVRLRQAGITSDGMRRIRG